MATAHWPDGRVIVTVGDYETVRAWDLATGIPLSSPLIHPDGVLSVATATLPGGRTVAVTGGHNGIVRMWDPVTATSLGEVADNGDTGEVRALATAALADGRVVAVTGSYDATGPGRCSSTRQELLDALAADRAVILRRV
ncbi:hypothetical protein [Nocardia sp. NPDC050710]|uniref:WD40 repeat domain-containing protein n=1 Tax=Nocardia sp. NPDC050710 TaxID=3157220 RepID=UPI00340E8AD1